MYGHTIVNFIHLKQSKICVVHQVVTLCVTVHALKCCRNKRCIKKYASSLTIHKLLNWHNVKGLDCRGHF